MPGQTWQLCSSLLHQLPWFHNCILLDKLSSQYERLWYIRQTIEYGWSRNILIAQIDSDLYHRQGKALTNFKQTLPPEQSDLAQQALKDPYVFDFLTLNMNVRESELEKELLDHVQRFLLELGKGFALVGQQYPFKVGKKEYSIDLLFYHIILHRFIVIDLKTRSFKPEYVGKMNFYLSVVDDQLRQSVDQPSIGLLLCRARDRLIVEYALRDIGKPIGIAEWKTKLVSSLPKNLKSQLPSIQELKDGLEKLE